MPTFSSLVAQSDYISPSILGLAHSSFASTFSPDPLASKLGGKGRPSLRSSPKRSVLLKRIPQEDFDTTSPQPSKKTRSHAGHLVSHHPHIELAEAVCQLFRTP